MAKYEVICSAYWSIVVNADNEGDAIQHALDISSVTPVTELTPNVDANEVFNLSEEYID